ncbi:MAG: SLBB domain-containing protein [Planctomycetes bacterium]|nr:SLBB domain-containing protein [Planctomycetota bacterium]
MIAPSTGRPVSRSPAAPRAGGFRAPVVLFLPLLAWAASAAAGCGTMDAPSLVSSPDERTAPTLPPPPVGGYNLDRPYPLLPGDKITITVLDDPDLNFPATIPSDGVIEVFRTGKDGSPNERIPTNSMTVEDLEKALREVYARTVLQKPPYVQVTLTEAVKRVVYVMGAVKAEGTKGEVELPKAGQRLTLSRAIMAAGGPAEDGDLSAVTISRKDPSTGTEVSLPVFDLDRMLRENLFDRDPPLEPNDIIKVPRLGRVWITGNINESGSFLCTKGMTLTMLITEAGGLKAFSARSDIRVLRAGEGGSGQRAYTVNYNDILDGVAPDPVLQPGDRVAVEETWY